LVTETSHSDYSVTVAVHLTQITECDCLLGLYSICADLEHNQRCHSVLPRRPPSC